jgi:hypothetical protein
MTSEKRRNALGLLAVLFAFAVSRGLYAAAGITFNAEILSSWHLIDPALLRADLWRSVFYLHSQPPLTNLLVGLALRIFPENYAALFHVVYYAAGMILAGAIYSLGIFMRFPVWLAASISALFALSPAAVLFEHFLTNAYPLAALLTLAGVFLYQFAVTKRKRWGIMFFSMLAVIALTWSLFHLIWLLGIAAGLYFLLGESRKVTLAALVPVLLVTGWYAKNAVITGDFTASTWAGMNLSRIATFRVAEHERKQLVEAGRLSPFALIPPFRNPYVYLKLLPDTPTTGVPILDTPETSLNTRNQHHLVYAEASRYYLKDALRLIVMKPGVYSRSVIQALYIYFHSASDYEFLESNRARIDRLDRTWDRLFYGQWQIGEAAGERLNQMKGDHIGWGIVAAFLTAIIGGIYFLRANRARLGEPVNLLALFMLYNILFVTIIGVTLEIGENNRFRFTVDPLILLLFVFTIQNIITLIQGAEKTTRFIDLTHQPLRGVGEQTMTESKDRSSFVERKTTPLPPRKMDTRGTLSATTMFFSFSALTVSMLGAGRLVFDVFSDGADSDLNGILIKIGVLGFAFMIGWTLALVSIRAFGNLVYPVIIKFYAWSCLAVVSLIYLKIVQSLFSPDVSAMRFWAYLVILLGGLAALLFLHLLIEDHDLRPFSIPLLAVSALHLSAIVRRYVFVANPNGDTLFGDFTVFVMMISIAALMLMRLGLFSPMRKQIHNWFAKNGNSNHNGGNGEN